MQQNSFYGILDTTYVSEGQWENKCKALISGGCDLIQMRAIDKNAFEKENLLNRILPFFEDCNIPLLLNVDLDIALKYPGVGLHIGQEDTPLEKARDALGPDRILGISTHCKDDIDSAIESADQLDYYSMGPIFASKTKPEVAPIGFDLIRYAASKNSTLPFYCIGGISRTNIHQVMDAGAKGIVSVSDILCDEDTANAVRTSINNIHTYLP